MLKGGQGSTKQKAMRLLVDLGEAAGAKRLIPVTSAHVSGVSPLTGGEGLIRFLKDLTAEGDSETAVENGKLEKARQKLKENYKNGKAR